MIKYLGSKRLLLPLLVEIVKRTSREPNVIDLFSGTARVGHALKAAGFSVLANDHNRYAATLARCYVAADLGTHEAAAKSLVAEFNRLPGRAGYFTETYCVQSRYFQPKNGERIEAIREAIAAKNLEPTLEAVVLTSLMEAADRVDSTTGVQMAYLKQWAARASNDLCLRMPSILPRAAGGAGEAHELDALDAAETLEADVAYLDPPYNQHKYLGNYHVWETLCRWDSPEVYGIACKRVDCRTRGSDFNSRPRATAALAKLIETVTGRRRWSCRSATRGTSAARRWWRCSPRAAASTSSSGRTAGTSGRGSASTTPAARRLARSATSTTANSSSSPRGATSTSAT